MRKFSFESDNFLIFFFLHFFKIWISDFLKFISEKTRSFFWWYVENKSSRITEPPVKKEQIND